MKHTFELYYFPSCPFCVRVVDAIENMPLEITKRNTREPGTTHQKDLLEGGGKTQVPCLKIAHPDGNIEWMYESIDIVEYLKGYLAKQGA